MSVIDLVDNSITIDYSKLDDLETLVKTPEQSDIDFILTEELESLVYLEIIEKNGG